MSVYSSETLDVYSILIFNRDLERMHLTVSYYDVRSKITAEARVLIDLINDIIWIDGERVGCEDLRRVIREIVVIKEKKTDG